MTNKDLETTHKSPPGSLGLPLIGETLSFLTDPNFIDKRQKLYGSIFKTQILGRPTVTAIGPDANRFILFSHAAHFSNDCWLITSLQWRKLQLDICKPGNRSKC